MDNSTVLEMIKNGSLNDKTLFHYTKLETALEYILPNMSLRMSPMINVNDPKESKAKNVMLSYNTNNHKNVSNDLSETKKIVNSILLNQSRMLCFSMNNKTSYKKVEQDSDETGLLYQMGFFKPRMWAQYAENHRGICLGFNKKALTKSINEIDSLKTYRSNVTYTDSTKGLHKCTHFDYNYKTIEEFKDYFIEEHIVNHRDLLYFTKSKDWKDENEYRYLSIVEKGEKDIFIDISEALTSVYLGVNFPEVYISSLKELLSSDTDIYKLDIHNGIPLVYENI